MEKSEYYKLYVLVIAKLPYEISREDDPLGTAHLSIHSRR